MDIYLDFDGTVVEHAYPKLGRCNFGCFEVIKKLQDAGHKIILNTYRADIGDGSLEMALEYINEHACYFVKDRALRQTFKLDIADYCPKKIHPPKFDWADIINANQLFIDDQAYGTPLKKAVMSNGMMVDWDELDKQFEANGMYLPIIPKELRPCH